MTRILLTVIFLTFFGQTACAEEKYSGYLDKYKEVANDGRLFGPEETKRSRNQETMKL